MYVILSLHPPWFCLGFFFGGEWDESRKLANIIAQDSTGMKFEVAESYSDHSTWHEKVTVFMCSMGRDTK